MYITLCIISPTCNVKELIKDNDIKNVEYCVVGCKPLILQIYIEL